jgi:hypothetical protein
LHEGRKGKSVIFATPQGNFLSPKAVENELLSQRQEMIKACEGMRKNPMTGEAAMDNTVTNAHVYGYNQALSDCIGLISKMSCMKMFKQPTEVTVTFAPKDYWLKKCDDEFLGDFMLVHRIDMSYKGKDDQEGSPVLYMAEKQAEMFRDAGFGELL